MGCQLILYAKSSCNQTDFIARICDVHPDGRSINVPDGLVRLSLDNAGERDTVEETEDGILKITIKLWPTAYSFARGHRLRLQVSSCAHPRWARNLGVGGSQLGRTEMAIAEQMIFHDEMHQSTLKLPCL